MDRKPLSMDEAWQSYDEFFLDDRVRFMPEPPGTEPLFRKHAAGRLASPKVWADAWLLAFAEAAGGRVITFDRGLGARGAFCLVSDRTS